MRNPARLLPFNRRDRPRRCACKSRDVITRSNLDFAVADRPNIPRSDMARPRSKARSTRNGKNKNSLKQREHRDQQGEVQRHTTKYEDGEASQSGEPQKRPRSPSASSKRPSEQSDQSSNPLNQPKSSVAQPGSEGRSTRHGRNSVHSGEASLSREPQKSARSSSTSSKPGSDESDQASKFGSLAKSIFADRPGLLLAAAAAAGTFLISR